MWSFVTEEDLRLHMCGLISDRLDLVQAGRIDKSNQPPRLSPATIKNPVRAND